MQHDIIEKIRKLVDKGVESEAECVYLLAQIRKYLEQQDIPGYWDLRMCANWALHSKLDNQSVKILLEELNEFLVDSENQQSFDLKRHPSLKSKLSFVAGLQSDLKEFLTGVGIDTRICDDDNTYSNLLCFFTQVIEDTPLVCRAKNTLSHVTEISFGRRRSLLYQDLLPLDMMWHIRKYEKTILRLRHESSVIDFGVAKIKIGSFIYITNEND
ncbi:MAG: hypothetical protein LBE37_16535 [Sphingobacterium sp.]|jgi:hypothetical protein|nr:hypothetical protein [Sphingobacterium sp.]